MITDADVKKLKRTFATKEELEKLDSRTAEGFLNVQNQLLSLEQALENIRLQLSDLNYHSAFLKDKTSFSPSIVFVLFTTKLY